MTPGRDKARKPPGKRRRQNFGMIVGGVLGAAVLAVLLWPGSDPLHARGPMNTGHESLRCEYCHLSAPGTARQQLQAKARHLLGLRATGADFGLQRAGNAQCLACHERPDDRHPVFRFNEPRFQEAREALHPETCISCHLEHSGVRITAAEIGYCRHCHEETQLKRDPIDVAHADLIVAERWDTCLGCHDFHGNHVMEESLRIDEAVPRDRIEAYFRGGASPYGDIKRHPPRTEPLP